MKIYKIVFDRDTYELQNKVEELLNNGWELVGGLVVDGSYNYYQALIKEQQDD